MILKKRIKASKKKIIYKPENDVISDIITIFTCRGVKRISSSGANPGANHPPRGI